MHVLSVAIGGAIGALLRWALGILFNPLFPTLPLGTLVANLSGGYVIGMMMALIEIFPTFPETLRLAIITGFLGGLTTFSTFSAETITLIYQRNYLFASVSMASHVGGSLIMTFLGHFSLKLFWSKIG